MRIEISIQTGPTLSYLKPIQVHWCKANGERQLLQSFSLNEKSKAIEFCRSIAAYPEDEVIDLSQAGLHSVSILAHSIGQKN